MKRTTRERVEEMKREIERRGGNLHVDDTLPLEVQELFLKEVLSCPDCAGGKKQNH
jgi:hypothetical protein